MYKMSVLCLLTLSVTWLHRLWVLRKAKQISVMHVAPASQQQQALGCCFNVLLNSFKTTDQLQAESLKLLSQYPREV
jgi:hypothetical protein